MILNTETQSNFIDRKQDFVTARGMIFLVYLRTIFNLLMNIVMKWYS